jgi:hypothetical protein
MQRLPIVLLFGCAGAEGPLSPEALEPYQRCDRDEECVLARNAPPSCCPVPPFDRIVAIDGERLSDLADAFAAPSCEEAACPAVEHPSLEPRFTENRFETACVEGLCAITVEQTETGRSCEALPCPDDYVCIDNAGVPAMACWYEPGAVMDCGEAPLPPEAPATPVAAEAPRIACPLGWGSGATCEPFPLGISTCAAGSALFPGGGCSVLGDSCSAVDPFAIHVDAGAAGPGDGSSADPFPTIAAALAIAAPSDRIRAAPGRYLETFAIPSGVTLAGACAEEVIIEGNITLDGELAQAQVEGEVLVSGDARIESAAISTLMIEGALAANELAAGEVHASGGEVSIARGSVGRLAASQSSIGLRDVALLGGEIALDGGTLTATSVAIEGGGIAASGVSGRAVDLSIRGAPREGLRLEGGRWELSRCQVLGTAAAAVATIGGAVRASDVVVEEVAPVAGLGDGIGWVVSGAELTLSRARFERTAIGVLLTANGTARIEDLELVTSSSFGLWMQSATATIARARISAATSVAVLLERSALEASDLEISQVAADAQGRGGIGTVVRDGARLSLSRSAIRASKTYGLFVSDATLRAGDLEIVGVAPAEEDGRFGVGLLARRSTLALERARIDGAAESGVRLLEGVDLSASDLEIDDTTGLDALFSGRAIWIYGGAQAVLERTRVLRARGAGILAGGAGTAVSAMDLVIADVAARACAPCDGPAGGTGIASLGGATVALHRVLLDGGAAAGLQVDAASDLDASDGEISGYPIAIGAHPAFDRGAIEKICTAGSETAFDPGGLVPPTIPGPDPFEPR